MTEKEKMLANQLYDPSDAELVQLRRLARNKMMEFNHLNDDEFVICNKCKEKEKQEKQKKQERILKIFYSMNEYEQKALEEFIHKIGKEYKREVTKKKIEQLQKELEKENNE